MSRRSLISLCRLSLMLSFLFPPLALIAQDPPLSESIIDDSSTLTPKRIAVLTGGAFLLGTVGGAVAGHNAAYRHHSHSSSSPSSLSSAKQGPPGLQGPPGAIGATGLTGAAGPTGPAGINPFIPDEGAILTFTLVSDVSPTSDIPFTATPFVTSPNGTMIVGTPVLNPIDPINPNPYTYNDIVVTDPVFGSYQVGVFFDGAGIIVAGVTGTVTGTRITGSNTLPQTIQATLAPTGQISIAFSYGPDGIPE